MFTFVIGLVLVGAALALAARVVMGEAPQPATGQAVRNREATRAPATEAVGAVSWAVRLRSIVMLTALLAIVGAFVALLVILAGALLFTALKSAVQ